MKTITQKNLADADHLGRADRALFDHEYNAWLARDEADGAPDYTLHFRDQRAVLDATLGETGALEVTSHAERLLEAGDLNAHETLETRMDAIGKSYADAWGPLPK